MVPWISSSTDGTDAPAGDNCAPFVSSSPLLLSTETSSSDLLRDPVLNPCWVSPDCLCSTPSWEVFVRPGSVRLVAAKTEGDEMGQYVMAVYRKQWLHLRAPISMRGCMLHEAHASWVMQGWLVVELGGELTRGAAVCQPGPCFDV
jgi:hypothetical protein